MRALMSLPASLLEAVAACHDDCAGPLGYTIAELAEVVGCTPREAQDATAILRRRGRWRLKPRAGLKRQRQDAADRAAPKPSEIRWRCWQIQEEWEQWDDPRLGCGVVRARVLRSSGPVATRGRD